MISAPAPPFLRTYQARVDRGLDRILPADSSWPETVHASMRYTALAPSKRVRAAVAYLSGDLLGREDRAEGVALAVELVHAASLILDDLPSMDDAPLRRGRRSNHLVYGVATAQLASFALLARAFQIVADTYEPPVASALTRLIGETVGSVGLVAGQADDLQATHAAVTFERLERIHRHKTGVLFGAAATGGALSAGAGPDQLAALGAFAKNLGLAFQIVDDLLEVTGDPADTGKQARTDMKKTTFISFSGVEGARELARELCDTADRSLAPFGSRADKLRMLSRFVACRSV